MSGGAFDHKQYYLGYIADSIEQEIVNSGKPRDHRESWEDANFYEYPEEVISKFKDAVQAIRIAQVYANRVDWLISGDDGIESFLQRLNDDLEKL